MSRRNKFFINKILILMSALLLVLLLCGCRTRVTNNTEVTNTLEDGGLLEESYQMRRDELGIPVAETPLFTGWESGDEEYVDDEEYYDEEFYDEEFEDDEYYDDEYEEEETDNTNTSQTRRPGNGPQIRPAVRPADPVTEMVRVVLDVNGKDATCSSSFVMVKKGQTYGSLPEPSRKGYDFKGWYTAKKDGDKVTSKTKLKSDKEHTLYAHWKKAEKKTYTVTFDGNGGDDEVTLSSSEITVKEDGKYGKMPSAKRKKYTFKGWFTEAEGGKQVTSDTKFTANADQTLYAQWEYDPYTWWDGEFKASANEVDESLKALCVIDDGDESEQKFVNDCKGSSPTDDTAPAYIIKFIKNYEKSSEDGTIAKTAEDLYVKYKDSAPGATVIIMSDEALKGTKEQQLLYRMLLFDALYGNGGDPEEDTEKADRINEASSDLLEADALVDSPYIYSGGDYADPSVPVDSVPDDSGSDGDIVEIDAEGDITPAE